MDRTGEGRTTGPCVFVSERVCGSEGRNFMCTYVFDTKFVGWGDVTGFRRRD